MAECRLKETQVGNLWEYCCSECGKVYRYSKRKPDLKLDCDGFPEWLTCKHRGSVVATLDSRKYGCGCGQVAFHECKHYQEPVVLRLQKQCIPRLRGRVAGFTGKTCKTCELWDDTRIRRYLNQVAVEDFGAGATVEMVCEPSPMYTLLFGPMMREHADILHVTPRPDWQRIIARERYAVPGIQADELTRPTIDALRDRMTSAPPRLVFVHAFAVPSQAVATLARKHPDTRFVFALHSHENHVLTWPSLMQELRDALAASRDMGNVWFASSSRSGYWQELGYKRAIRWEWPVKLPAWQEPPSIDPPTILISSRVDLVKGIPAQIVAAALLQRRHKCRVALSLPTDSGPRGKAIADLTAAAGLTAERWPWAGPEEFERRLREQVSVVLQPSMSETFNYVSIEAGAVGRPWVGSAAIQHTPDAWRSDPNDPADIARVGQYLLANYADCSWQARDIAEQVAKQNNAAYTEMIKRLLL